MQGLKLTQEYTYLILNCKPFTYKFIYLQKIIYN